MMTAIDHLSAEWMLAVWKGASAIEITALSLTMWGTYWTPVSQLPSVNTCMKTIRLN